MHLHTNKLNILLFLVKLESLKHYSMLALTTTCSLPLVCQRNMLKSFCVTFLTFLLQCSFTKLVFTKEIIIYITFETLRICTLTLIRQHRPNYILNSKLQKHGIRSLVRCAHLSNLNNACINL